jgi:hypothetical protein
MYVCMGIDGQRVDDELLSFLLPYSYVVKLARWVGVFRCLLAVVLMLWVCLWWVRGPLLLGLQLR